MESRGEATAWDSSGVTVDWTASSSQVYHYLAIRGLSSTVTPVVGAAANGGTSTATGLPWQPDAGILLSAMRPSASFHTPGTPNVDTGVNRRRRFSTGAWTSTANRFGSHSNVYDNTNLHEIFYGNGMVSGVADQDGVINRTHFDLTAVTSDGFTFTTTISGVLGGQRPMAVLALNNEIPVDDEDDPIWASTVF
jgi:hypothetical protein